MPEQQCDRIFLSAPDQNGYELEFVKDALASNYLAPVGDMLDRFEREFRDYVGAAHAIALSSATAALHLSLRLSGVSAGKEVWCSSLTFIGGIAPITYLNAEPVLIDNDLTSWNMDANLVADELKRAAASNKLPAAILPTDLYGQCCDMDAFIELGEQYDVPIIFDSAEALGATYKGRHAGMGAKASVFSLNGNKIITSSGGGMLITQDEEFAQKALFLAQQARDPAPYYQHSTFGYNYRMSNIIAAIGLGQFQNIDERVARRRRIFNLYEQALGDLPGISFMPEADYGKCTRWLTVMQIDREITGTDPETVRLALEEHNIETRPAWKPMHLQPVFKGARVVGGDVAEQIFERGLCLPSGSGLGDEDIERVTTVLKQCLTRS